MDTLASKSVVSGFKVWVRERIIMKRTNIVYIENHKQKLHHEYKRDSKRKHNESKRNKCTVYTITH